MSPILKDQAAFSAGAAESAIYEVRMLRDIAERIQHMHDCPGECEEATEQILVLADVAEEKLEIAFENLMIVTQYFGQNTKTATDISARQCPQAFTAIRNISQN